MKKLVLVFALLLAAPAAFADGSGNPPTKRPATAVASTDGSAWSAFWAWLTSGL
jgi:hypothetical protein